MSTPNSSPTSGRTRTSVRVVEEGRVRRRSDAVATEEPLEIRVEHGGATFPLAITMRTPGGDFDLAAGFMFTEGLIRAPEDIPRISYCLDAGADRRQTVDVAQQFNVVTVELRAGLGLDLRGIERRFPMTSACGVCGKASLDQLEMRGLAAPAPGPAVPPDVIYGLPDTLRAAQGLFDQTGGLHAAGLFDAEGRLLALREDVGRHNALDKLIGWALFQHRLPLTDHIVMVSGRLSFELMQKSLAAGVPIVCAVSAPSSLAVDVARRFGMTLVGFVRGRRFNVYAGAERIRL